MCLPQHTTDEADILALTLAEVLPEEDEGPPPPWDERGEYRCSNVEVYFQVRGVSVGRWGGGRWWGIQKSEAHRPERGVLSICAHGHNRPRPRTASLLPRAPTSRGWRKPTRSQASAGTTTRGRRTWPGKRSRQSWPAGTCGGIWGRCVGGISVGGGMIWFDGGGPFFGSFIHSFIHRQRKQYWVHVHVGCTLQEMLAHAYVHAYPPVSPVLPPHHLSQSVTQHRYRHRHDRDHVIPATIPTFHVYARTSRAHGDFLERHKGKITPLIPAAAAAAAALGRPSA